MFGGAKCSQGENVEVFVGFQLDGFRGYENTAVALPNITLSFNAAPEILTRDDVIVFDPDISQTIDIPVSQSRHYFYFISYSQKYKIYVKQ